MLQNQEINKITFQGNIMHLVGKKMMLNKLAPDSILINNNMEEVNLLQFKEKIKVMISEVSLYTPVCELQIEEFNKSAADFSKDILVIIITKDLPFAQKKFCTEHKLNNLTVLSDYKYSSFSINYGLLIKELNLLSSSIIILDNNDVIRYIQIAKEAFNQLDYDNALKNLNNIIQTKKCISCETETPPTSADIIDSSIRSLFFFNFNK